MKNKKKNFSGLALSAFALAFVMITVTGVTASPPTNRIPHLSIPILGTSINEEYRPVGLVSQIIIDLYERRDQDGLRVQFYTEPGQFSLKARKAIQQAIYSFTGSCPFTIRVLDGLVEIPIHGSDRLWRKSIGDGGLECRGHGQRRPSA